MHFIVITIVFCALLGFTKGVMTRQQHGFFLVLILPLTLGCVLILTPFLNEFQLAGQGELTNILFGSISKMSPLERFRNSYGGIIIESLWTIVVLGIVTLPFGIYKLIGNKKRTDV